MAKKPVTPVEQLRQLLRYDSETGGLFWLPRGPEWFPSGYRTKEGSAAIWNARYAGTPALAVPTKAGYTKGTLQGRTFLAHRVAYALHHGVELSTLNEIDHIDGDKRNNRISNLRDVTHAENSRNTPLRRRNTRGIHGVSWSIRDKRWTVTIGSRHVASLKSFEDACAARRTAELDHGYHHNHGRPFRK